MRPTRRAGRVWGPFCRAVMGWEGLEEVGSPVRRAGRGCEALLECLEGSGGTPEMGGRSLEPLLEGRDGS